MADPEWRSDDAFALGVTVARGLLDAG
jgi:hypothetical protein